METGNVINVVGSLANLAKEAKEIANTFPLNFSLPPTRSKLDKIHSKLDSLEKKLTTNLPKMAELIRAYSSLLAEVKIAKALSDKTAELISFVQDFDIRLLTFFSNDIESKHGNICRMVMQLPIVDSNETGELNRELLIIRDYIRDLKKESQEDLKSVKKYFDNISTHYTDVEGILSRLLARILESLKLPDS